MPLFRRTLRNSRNPYHPKFWARPTKIGNDRKMVSAVRSDVMRNYAARNTFDARSRSIVEQRLDSGAPGLSRRTIVGMSGQRKPDQ
jgi:hypothetical protein